MGRRVIALVAAALLALFGIIAMIVYVRSADARAIADADAQTVYVTQKVVPAGTKLQDAVDQKLIVQTSVAAKAKPIGALTTVDDGNKNLVAITDIGVGEFVLTNRFGETPTGTRALPVPSGMIGITMRLKVEEAVDYFATPGSKVVIYTTYDMQRIATPGAAPLPSGLETWKETAVLLDDVTVLGVNQTTLLPQTAAPTEGGADNGQTDVYVTVAVKPDDAVRLVHAIRETELYLGLRGEGAQVDLSFVVSSVDVSTMLPNRVASR